MKGDSRDPTPALLAGGERWDPLEEQLAIAGIQERMFGRPCRPKAVARYLLLEPVGGGAMGLVWRAYDPTLDRKVAVKLIRAVPGARAEAHAALLREAQTIAGISHPNVVAVFDTGTYEERDVFDDGDGVGVFLVMELVEGPTLAEWLAARERRWRDVVEVMLAAARGLAAVHRRGLVHRDIKPANVLVGDPVRIADFGLAAAASGEHEPAAPRVIAGTPGYMAPEQYEGRFDAKSDQYAFCVTLWRALYGHVPSLGSSARGERREREPPIPTQPPNTSVPRWLHAIAVRGLQRDPALRFPDMDQLVRALARDPTRVVVRGAAVALAVGAALAVGFGLGRPHGGPCDDDPMQAVWNEPIAEQLDRRFVETRVPYAAESLALVRHGLDDYAETWREGWQRVCGASIDAAQQAELACLQRGLHRVGGLVEMLQAADPTVIERAAMAVDDLPRPRECAGDGARAPSWAVPASRGDIERGEALLALGRADQARTLADESLARAQSDAERADAELLRCRVELDAHELPAAIDACERAWLAAEAAGTGLLAIEALLTGAQARTALDRPLDALRRVELANAKVHAIGAPAELRLRLEGERAAAQQGLDPALALELAEAHVAAMEREHGEDSTRLLMPLNLWAILARDNGDLAAARQIHARALALAERRLGPAHPRVGGVLNNLGANEWAAGHHVLAIALLERSLAIKRMASGWSTTRTATGWANLAEVHLSLGDHAAAIEHARRALEVRLHAFGEHAGAVADSRQILARALRRSGDLVRALAEAERAVAAIAGDTGGNDLEDETRLELAWTELELGRHASARAGFLEVLEERVAIAAHPALELSSPLVGLAVAHAGEGAWADAEEAWAQAEQIFVGSRADPLLFADAQLRWAAAQGGFDPLRARELRAQARALYLQHAPWHPVLTELALAELER